VRIGETAMRNWHHGASFTTPKAVVAMSDKTIVVVYDEREQITST
jgi:hypothetical protein